MRSPCRHTLVCLAALSVGLATGPAAQGKRPLAVDNLYDVRDVRDPQRSPDGKWVAYTVTGSIRDTDKNDTDVWMVSWDGKEHIQLTSTPDGEIPAAMEPGREGTSRSSRPATEPRARRSGCSTGWWGSGQAHRHQGRSDRLRLVARQQAPVAGRRRSGSESTRRRTTRAKRRRPRPPGRSSSTATISSRTPAATFGRASHLYLFDIATKKAEVLTPGTFDETAPAWSPDGGRSPLSADIVTMASRQDAGHGRVRRRRAGRRAPRDDFDGDRQPKGRPDQLEPRRQIDRVSAGRRGQDTRRTTGAPRGHSVQWRRARKLTRGVDRPVSRRVMVRRGPRLTFVVIDDRTQYVGRVPAAGGPIERLTDGRRVVTSPRMGQTTASLCSPRRRRDRPRSTRSRTAALRKLTRAQRQLARRVCSSVRPKSSGSSSRDGTEVHGLIVKPPRTTARDAAIRRCSHPRRPKVAGPARVQLRARALRRERLRRRRGELPREATAGAEAIRRRSSPTGATRKSWTCWRDGPRRELGHCRSGRLGIGGWSYGGILTNYMIATDARFKAATSGAGSSNQMSMYGTDQYIRQYERSSGRRGRTRTCG